MDLDGIGARCSLPRCGVQDFLPIKCVSCQLVFCRDHSSLDGHGCSSSAAPTGAGGDLHGKSSTTTDKCQAAECQERVLLSTDSGQALLGYRCPGCDCLVCLKHRHPPDHQCASPAMTMHDLVNERKIKAAALLVSTGHPPPPPASTTSASSSNSRPPPRKYNAKVELMKIKMKATGPSNIIPSKRLYIRLLFSFASGYGDRPCFVDSQWSLGRVLDHLAAVASLDNRNNALPVDDPKRVSLFDYLTGRELSTSYGDTANVHIQDGQFIIVSTLEHSRLSDDGSCRYLIDTAIYQPLARVQG